MAELLAALDRVCLATSLAITQAGCQREHRAELSGSAGKMSVNIMGFVAKQQTNGKIKRLSTEELAKLMVPATAKTPAEKEAALKRATTGLRAKVRVTRDMYRPR